MNGWGWGQALTQSFNKHFPEHHQIGPVLSTQTADGDGLTLPLRSSQPSGGDRPIVRQW